MSQDTFTELVQYFGENPKLAQPNTVFPVLQRFITSLKVTRSWSWYIMFDCVYRKQTLRILRELEEKKW